METGNFEIALRALATNRVRTSLTVAIIAVGIMSLVSIQTALEIMTDKVVGSYSRMGAAMFTVSSKEECSPISLREARRFKEEMLKAEPLASVSVSVVRRVAVQAKYGSRVTDPLVSIVEADENYLLCNSGEMGEGRLFSRSEFESRSATAVIGDNICRKLFPDGNPVGQTVTAGGGHYRVVGRIAKQGSLLGTGLDNSIIIPISADGDFCLTVRLPQTDEGGASHAAAAARSLMRAVRRTPAAAADDFLITKADSLQDNLDSVKSKLSLAALVIGLITLLGSSVGLMNIMLVAVKERTREIGIRKALGARHSVINRQFLSEAVVIGQIGGVAGTVLGILLGNLVAIVMEGRLTIPWNWVALSVVICLCVSVLSGVVPARRAAALDPIEALRRE